MWIYELLFVCGTSFLFTRASLFQVVVDPLMAISATHAASVFNFAVSKSLQPSNSQSDKIGVVPERYDSLDEERAECVLDEETLVADIQTRSYVRPKSLLRMSSALETIHDTLEFPRITVDTPRDAQVQLLVPETSVVTAPTISLLDRSLVGIPEQTNAYGLACTPPHILLVPETSMSLLDRFLVVTPGQQQTDIAGLGSTLTHIVSDPETVTSSVVIPKQLLTCISGYGVISTQPTHTSEAVSVDQKPFPSVHVPHQTNIAITNLTISDVATHTFGSDGSCLVTTNLGQQHGSTKTNVDANIITAQSASSLKPHPILVYVATADTTKNAAAPMSVLETQHGVSVDEFTYISLQPLAISTHSTSADTAERTTIGTLVTDTTNFTSESRAAMAIDSKKALVLCDSTVQLTSSTACSLIAESCANLDLTNGDVVDLRHSVVTNQTMPQSIQHALPIVESFTQSCVTESSHQSLVIPSTFSPLLLPDMIADRKHEETLRVRFVAAVAPCPPPPATPVASFPTLVTPVPSSVAAVATSPPQSICKNTIVLASFTDRAEIDGVSLGPKLISRILNFCVY